MHERALMRNLVDRIVGIAEEEQAGRVTRVAVRLGALSHFTPEHFLEHFEHAARGTCAEGAAVDAELEAALDDPRARDVVLESVEVET